MLQSCQGRPVLWSYQSDCTSILTAKTGVTKAKDSSIARKGFQLTELYLERGLLVAPSKSRAQQACVVAKEPRILSAGKTGWVQFAAACEFSKTMRSLHHNGIIVNHCCMDRGALSALGRALQQRLEAQYIEDLNPNLDPDHERLQVMDWFVSCGCALHDTSNALNWALKPFQSPQMLSDLYIVVASVRKGFTFIKQKVPLFIVQHLKCGEEVMDWDSVRQFWTTVGVDSGSLDNIMEADLHWDGSS
eukprot:9405917-Lingulodinium_polyedra.AAC.1